MQQYKVRDREDEDNNRWNNDLIESEMYPERQEGGRRLKMERRTKGYWGRRMRKA
mgnify:CR=1 FL=1